MMDISRSIIFIPMLGTASIQYFLCSYISGNLEDSFDNVGNSLYSSQWYLLNPKQRKDFLKVLMMANKRKTLTVGPFALCTLERFSKVSNKLVASVFLKKLKYILLFILGCPICISNMCFGQKFH